MNLTRIPLLLFLFATVLHAEPYAFPGSSESIEPDNRIEHDETRQVRVAQALTELDSTDFSVLMSTPALHRNQYEKGFGSIGNNILLSIPLTQVAEIAYLHLETGVQVSFAHLTPGGAESPYSHVYFAVPVTGRVLFPISRRTLMEAFAGAVIRPWESSSKPASEGGGFRSVSGADKFEPDLGVGISFRLTPNLRIRTRLSYLMLAAGIELRM